MVPKNKLASNRRWNEANLDRLYITVPRGTKETIQTHAASFDESINHFVFRAVQEQMHRDKLTGEEST